MGIRGKEDFTLERSGRGRDKEGRSKKPTTESRWEAMKEKHKGKDDEKKQTHGMRVE